MKFIIFNADLRLNGQDEHAVICKTSIPYSEENLEYARKHCVSGELVIEDLPGEPVAEPTLADRVASLETDTADMAEALDQILNSGVA